MKPLYATVFLVIASFFAAPLLAGAPYHHMHMTATDPAKDRGIVTATTKAGHRLR